MVVGGHRDHRRWPTVPTLAEPQGVPPRLQVAASWVVVHPDPASLRKLWQARWNVHSKSALTLPRSRSWWPPWATLIWPKTGSTIALRRAYPALPFLVRSLRLISCLGVRPAGIRPRGTAGGFSPCLSRPVANSGSIPASVTASTLSAEKYPASASSVAGLPSIPARGQRRRQVCRDRCRADPSTTGRR